MIGIQNTRENAFKMVNNVIDIWEPINGTRPTVEMKGVRIRSDEIQIEMEFPFVNDGRKDFFYVRGYARVPSLYSYSSTEETETKGYVQLSSTGTLPVEVVGILNDLLALMSAIVKSLVGYETPWDAQRVEAVNKKWEEQVAAERMKEERVRSVVEGATVDLLKKVKNKENKTDPPYNARYLKIQIKGIAKTVVAALREEGYGYGMANAQADVRNYLNGKMKYFKLTPVYEWEQKER